MLRAQDRGIKREAGAVVATKSEGNGIGKFGIGAKEAVRKPPPHLCKGSRTWRRPP